ncbi:MAG: hypothetical protein H7Y19_05500 [Luteimonas sp.]|nr:hypothetical protein [Luteimonas sp.]
MRGSIAFVLLASLGTLLLLQPNAAQAQVRRCSGPDGTLVFTDRKCEDVGATERVPRDALPGAGRMYRGGCSRNLQDLIYEMTAAIDSRDVNRLASLYHWVGMSSRGSYGVMGRLDGIAQRPLVDIVALQPIRRIVVQNDDGTRSSVDPTGVDPTYYPQASANRTPVALRVEQTLANGSTPSRTVFGLRRHLGCWWVTL